MAIPFFGTTLAYGDGATAGLSTNWTPIANIKAIKMPKIEAEDIKTTHTESPDATHEYIPGVLEPGEYEVTFFYDADDAAELFALLRVQKGFRIIYEDGAGWAFSGYMKGYTEEGDIGSAVEATVTMKVSGLQAATTET